MGAAVFATVKTWKGALSSERRDSGPGTSRVREKTSKGPAKSRISTSSKIRIPTFHLSMSPSWARDGAVQSQTLRHSPISHKSGWACSDRDRAKPEDDHGEDHDREAAEHGIAVRADEDLGAAENERGEREIRERHAGHQDEHEGVDEPGDPEVRVNADERGQEGAGESGQPGSQAERHAPHEPGVDTQSLRELLVPDHCPGAAVDR